MVPTNQRLWTTGPVYNHINNTNYEIMVTILRRRRLGRTSCREISRNMQTPSMVLRNDRMHRYDPRTEMVVRWGCTSNVDCNNVLNSSLAIHQVNDKLGFRRILNEHDLCPPTYFDRVSAGEVIAGGGVLVVRPLRHAQGRNLFVARTMTELDHAIVRCNRFGGWYASDLINKVAEYRVFVGSGRAVWVAEKVPRNPEEVAWNNATGNGVFENVRWDDWPLKAVRYAVEAYNLSELHFGGVDVMVDGDGNAYVIEINSAPSQTSPYRQECVAKYIDYVVQHGKDRLPVAEERGGYRKWGHPCLSENIWNT